MTVKIESQVELELAIKIMTAMGQDIKKLVADTKKTAPNLDTTLIATYYEQLRRNLMELIKMQKAVANGDIEIIVNPENSPLKAPKANGEKEPVNNSPQVQELIAEYMEEEKNE